MKITVTVFIHVKAENGYIRFLAGIELRPELSDLDVLKDEGH